MKPLAIFYHTILSGGSVPVDTQFACRIMADQMAALDKSGLLAAADEFYIGVNGDQHDADIARLFVPCPNARFFLHGTGATTEIPTLARLRAWLPEHPDWYVLYHHLKGISRPVDHPFFIAWRKRMEKAVVWGWRDCVAQLDAGMDSCGCHWMTPAMSKPGWIVKNPYWGGNFWWATAKFLLTLPPLPPTTWENRFEAESWIGYGPTLPKVKDYYPGWP